MPVRAADLETRLYVSDREFNRGLSDAERRAQRFVSTVNSTFSRAGQGMGMGGSRGGILPGLSQISEVIQGIPQIGQLAGALVGPLRDAAEEGVRFNMLIESATLGFKGVTGSIEDSSRYVKELTNFAAANPIFNTQGTIRAARMMNVFGFETRQTTDYLKTWGGALAAGGAMNEEMLQRVVRAFGQMRSLGRVNAEEMNQLAEAGIPGWELLAKAIGKTVAETRKLGEQGRLRGGASVEAITAMLKVDPRFAGQVDAFANTLEGRLAQLQDVREVAAGRATRGLTDDLNKALAGALGGDNQAAVQRMAEGLNAAITPVSGLVRASVVTIVGGGLTAGFSEAVNAAKAVLPGQMMSLGTDAIIAPLKSALGIQSPSKVTYDMGLMLAAGLQQGLSDGLRVGRLSEEVEKLIEEAAQKYGLDPNLIRAVIRKESGGRSRAVSPVGAAGLMQLMPATGQRYGVRPDERFNPRKNVMAGAHYLSDLLKMFGGREDLALAGYNSGEARKEYEKAFKQGRAINWSALPAGVQRETRPYVGHITRELSQVRSGLNPVPVRVVNQDGVPLGPLTDRMAGHIEELGFGFDMPTAPSLAGLIGSSLRPGDAGRGFALSASDATAATFELLKAMGQVGPEAEKGFGQASASAEDWAARVIDSGEKARGVFGITARDAAGAFEDSWVSAFTNVDQGLDGMWRNMVSGFAMSLNEMVQQWAASQMSSILGTLLQSVGGALVGGLFGGAKIGGVGSSAGSLIAGHFAAGTPSAPAGLALVGEEGPELVRFRGGERVFNNRESRQMLAAPPARQTVNHYYITTPAPRERAYVQKRSQRDLAETIAGALKQRAA